MSGRKNTIPPYKMFDNADMSQATLISNVTNIEHVDNIGIIAAWTGTAIGTIDIQVSQDKNTWVNHSAIPYASPAGFADNALANLNQEPWFWIRLLWTRTSGTGTLNATICSKMV